MDTKLILIAIVTGAIVATITGAVISFGNTEHATAQMSGIHMMDSGGMGKGMMTTQSSSMPWQGYQGSMFNANGMSAVNNVQITGVSISGSDEVTVDIRYLGKERSPAVTVIVITNPMAMMHGFGMADMGMMHGSQSGMMMQPMMGTSWGGSSTLQNNTLVHTQMMAQGTMGPRDTLWNGTSNIWPDQFPAMQSQTGSDILDAGWTSDSTLTVRLEGEGSPYNGLGIHVMVFPLTS